MNAPSSLSAPEQRRSRRIPCNLQVELLHQKSQNAVTALDVARHGILLGTGMPLRERHLVQLRIHLPHGPIQAVASIARKFQRGDGADAVGLEFFALSGDAKHQWDGFIMSLQPSSAGTTRPPSTPAPKTPPGAGQATTFLVRVKNLDRLREFAKEHVAAGELVLYTPLLHQVGDSVVLVCVHPTSQEEFHWPAIVRRVGLTRPKHLELALSQCTPETLARFDDFIETGTPPSTQLAPDELGIDVDMDFEDSFDGLDISVFDEVIDIEEVWAEPNPATRPVADAAIDNAALEEKAPFIPDLSPERFFVRCSRPRCKAEAYEVELGPCRGVLGLFADLRPYLTTGTHQVVSVPRALSAEEQAARRRAFVEAGGDDAAQVEMGILWEIAALTAPATDPQTGSRLKKPRALERVERKLARWSAGQKPERTELRCPQCKEGMLRIGKSPAP